jgi:RNA polymerase sigma-70 factor (ECF subfamily)
MFVVVRNYALDQLPRLQREVAEEPDVVSRAREPSNGDELEPGALDWISDRELFMFVERLPTVQRQVLALRYMLDLSYEEIATVLGRTVVDVRSLHSRATRFLRARLEALGRVPRERDGIRMRRRFRQAGVLRARRFALR